MKTGPECYWRGGGQTVWPEQHPHYPGVQTGRDIILHKYFSLWHECNANMTGQMSSSLCSQVPVPRKLFGNYSSLLIKFRLQRYVWICMWQKLIGKYVYFTRYFKNFEAAKCTFTVFWKCEDCCRTVSTTWTTTCPACCSCQWAGSHSGSSPQLYRGELHWVRPG